MRTKTIAMNILRNLTNSNQVRTLVSFCKSGVARKLLLWIVCGFNMIQDCMFLSCHVRVSEWIYTL